MIRCGRLRRRRATLDAQFEAALVAPAPMLDETQCSMAEGRAEVGVPIVNSRRAAALPDKKRYGEFGF